MIAGKTMIQRVYEQACAASTVSATYVATCDKEIAEAVQGFGGLAIMTSADLTCGTDRVAQAAGAIEAEIIVNVQGDEPLIDPRSIDAAVMPLVTDPTLRMSSLMFPITEIEAKDPNLVKVVVDRYGFALYFSRALIPYPRKAIAGNTAHGHAGLYAYRRTALFEFSGLSPTPLEQTECLEQLRALENGWRIRMVEIDSKPIGVDTPEDLARVEKLLAT